MFKHPIRLLALISLLLVVCHTGRAQEDDFATKPTKAEQGKIKHKSPSLFHRPARATPAEQLQYAQGLRAAGHARAAMKQFRALVHAWGASPQAAEAEQSYAELLAEAGKPAKAFDEYQYLIRFYAGLFSYEDILEKQFTLAETVMTRKHMALLFLPGYTAPEQALPLFEKIVENGPHWRKAAEAQFMIGQIHEQAKDYDEAVTAFEILQNRFVDPRFSAEAAARRAHCLYMLAERSPRDEAACRNALSALASFVTGYPDHEEVPEAQQHLDELKEKLALMYYERALFYDKMKDHPKSALIAYTDFLKKFPSSTEAGEASRRVEELKAELEARGEK